MTTLPKQTIRVAKGQDVTIRLRILAEEEVELAEAAVAAATSLTCRPLKACAAGSAPTPERSCRSRTPTRRRMACRSA